MENMFRPTASGVRRGTEDKPVFAAGIEPPAWKRHLSNSTLVETYKDQISDENRRAAQYQRATERAQAQKPPRGPSWKSGIGTVKRKLDDGTEEEYDANELLNDPEVGAIAEESLFKKDIYETKSEVERRSLMLQDPSRPKRMTDRERQDMELEGTMLPDTDARKQEISKRIADDDAVKSDYTAQEQAIFEGRKRLMELGQGGISAWREKRRPAPTLQGAVSNHEAVKSREAEFEQRGVELAAQEAELVKPVKGAELAATAPLRAEVAAKREQLAADRAAHAQEREQSGTAVAAQARREADAMDGKPSAEAAIRQNLAVQGGVGLTGVKAGMAETMKTGLNNATGGDSDTRLNRIIAAEGGRENARKFIESRIENLRNAKPSGRRMDGPSQGGMDSERQAFEGALAAMAKQDEVFAKNGVTDPVEQDRILADAAKESQWTENDTDKVRSLSTGELVINPGMVFGDREAVVGQIQGSSASEAEKQLAVRKLDAMRVSMAEKLENDLYYGDTRMFGIGEFRDFVKEKEAMGQGGDKVALLDEWSKKQKDRSGVFKLNDALWAGVAKGEIGIAKTVVGTAAGVAGAVGADSAQGLGKTQEMLGDAIQSGGEAEKFRGQTGGYGLTSELTMTVTQMAPMLYGGQVSQGLQGISRAVVGGMSVYGWAAAQGYESKLGDAVEMASQAKGSDLTGEEIAAVLGDGKTQTAAFLNGAQTAILAKVLGGGVERAALGRAANSMTVRDFIRRGGAQALRDGVLKKELQAMGKTILKDAGDEFVEESLNELLDGIISSTVLDKEMQFGDLLVESFKAGGMGAIVGGGLPQVRRNTGRRESVAPPAPATPERVNAELLANDPDAVLATPEEVTAAADIVGADPVDAAEGVIISREIAVVEAEAADGLAAAEENLAGAQASGDKGAITVAEANVKKARGAAIVGSRVRGALKIARGEDISSLTDAEARSLGIKRTKGGFAPMTSKELEAEGLAKPMLDFGADDSPVILDSVLDEIRAISPAAAARVKLTETETEARKAAQERADIDAMPDQKFTVTGRNGTSVQVKAKTPEQAESLAVEDAAWPMGEQVAGTAINEPNTKGKAESPPVQVPPVLTGTEKPANPVAAGSVVAGAGPAEAKAEAPVAGAEMEAADYERQRAGDPSLPSILETVQAAFDAGNPVSVSMVDAAGGFMADGSGLQTPDGYKRRGSLMVPPLATTPEKAEAPADALRNRTVAGDTGAAVGDAAVAGKAILRRVTRLRKNPKLAAAITISEDPADRAKATEDGKIVINLKALAAEASANGLDGKAAETWIAGVIDEEIRHLAQHEAARATWEAAGRPDSFKVWRNTHYRGIWMQEFVAKDQADAVRDLYGPEAFDALQTWQKAFEGLRMVSQKIATGNPTEASKLLVGRNSEFIAHLRAALKALKDFVAGIDASPALAAEIAAIEAALATFTNEQNTANPRNRPQKQPAVQAADADVRGPEKDSDRQAPVDGPVEPTRRDPALPAAEGGLVGKRVSWTRRGESLAGVVAAENAGFVIVNLTQPDAKGMGTANARVADLTVVPEMKGEKINKEWTAFAADSGTLGIPRAMMPQISAGDRSALVQFLKARGVSYSDATVPATTLKPTQTEYSPAKVEKAKAFEGGNRSILISSDNHVLDGHHQWMAAVESGEDIAVIRLDSPIRTLLPMALQMPSVTTAGGEILDAPAPQAEAPAETPAKPKAKKRRAVTDTPARREAYRLLSSQETELTAINKIIGGGGKLQTPPAGMLKIIAGLAKARSLTEKQMAMQRRWMGYDAFQPKRAFGTTFNGKVAQELWGMIFTQDESSSSLDDWAGRLGGITNDEAMLEVMGELDRVARGISRGNDPRNPNRELSGAEERQMETFSEANQWQLDRSDLFPGDLEIGEQVQISGEIFTVISRADGMVTLEDGEKFGTQRVPEGESLWYDMENSPFSPQEEAVFEAIVDELESRGYEYPHEFRESEPEEFARLAAEEFAAQDALERAATEQDRGRLSDGSGASPVGQGQGSGGSSEVNSAEQGTEDRPGAVSRPASKMDVKNADSRELFADDGGFALGQDSTVDGAKVVAERKAKVVAERKAKEDARAAQDAAQRDMFAAPPALSAAEQALKDAFSGMVDGLDAASLDRDADFYRSKGIPRDKRSTFMDVADMLYDAGVRTPQDLAAKLEKVGNGKLRAYSDAVWSILRSNYPSLPQSSDWAGIYSQINDTPSNDTAPSSNLEPDRPDAGSPDGSGESGVRAGRGPARGNGKPVVPGRNGSANFRQDNLRTDDVPAAPRGESGNPEPSLTAPQSEGRPANSANADGSRVPDANGVEAHGRGENDAHDGLILPAVNGTLAQGGKEGLRSVLDVKKSAPSLKAEQAEDVVFVETRLLTKGEPGVLLTNGTGTGKTFSGLGVVKRALDRGEKHVIIIAPSDKVVNDWIDTARGFFGIDDIGQLDGIRDNSKGNRVVVTTYANFGQNNELVRRPWGLVVTDEAHYLSQAKDGTSTLAQKTFKGLTWHPKEGVRGRISMEMAEELAEMAALRKSIDSNSRLMNRDDTMDQMVRALRDENRALETRLNALNSKVETRRAELQKIAESMKKADRPKAVFLSATPFAYHFSLDYAEGYLFEHGPEPTSDRYNTPSARGRFYMENFGYRMRYGKLTQPENAAATGILERMFAERLKREGAMRGRMLDVPFDYSRDFVLAESAIGSKIDEVLTLIRDDKRFEPLRSQLEIADYLARRYLLEGLKAREAVKRINEHLALGRKVVVFHDYKKNNAVNPLRLSSSDPAVKKAYDTLRAEFNGFDELVKSLDSLQSPIDVIRTNFPDAGFFNGDVPAKTRRENVKAFNQSGGKMNVILAQRAAGKEGISLHDIDAKHQRAFIDLGLPGRPTDAIQSEGRTIRLGMQSNGVLEYLTTGTSFERHTFAQTIATRASTAENLAMGENARSLLQAFSTGYNDARSFRPSKDQGTGGKKNDAARESGDPFDNAVALYFTNQKKTSRNKAEEGVDYFATPEPLGFKMVEWAGIRPGERVLEPSGGHGAIARFFPDSTIRHAVEPSYELAGRLALNAPDTKIHQVKFEDYDVINKFDVVVMNPPFGTAGKTAMDHLEKATRHLKVGGRVVALIPMGSSMENRFNKWYQAQDNNAPNGILYMAGEVRLPSVTFERAGTSISARIVILEKFASPSDASFLENRLVDLTSTGTTQELFERLRDTRMTPRSEPAVEKTPAQMMADLLNGGRDAKLPKTGKPQGIDGAFSAAEFIHTRDGNDVFVAKIDNSLSPSEYAAAKSLAKKHGGNYSSFNKGGAIPGFHFKDAETRDAFLGEAATPKEDSLQAAPLSGQQARIDKLMDIVGTPDPEILEEVATQQRVFKSSGKKVVGRPDLANPGRTEEERALYDQMDEARKWHATRETFGQWNAAANARNTPENDANLIEKVLKLAATADKAADMEEMPAAPAMTPEDTIHFRLMMERRFRESGGNKTKLAENAVLRNAYRSVRAAIARSLASGRDPFKTPEERNRETLINLMTELPIKDMRQIDARKWNSPQARDKAVEEAISKRLAEFEKQMKKLGITLEEITNKEVFMSLSQNSVLKNITKDLAAAEKMAVQMMQRGAGFDAIRRRTGLPETKIEAIRAQVEQELRTKLYAKVKAGLTLEDLRDQMKGETLSAAALNAASLLTEEQIQAELDRIISIGFGIPKVIQKTSGFRPKKKEEADDENDPNAAAKRVVRRWTERLATSQSDTLAWKSKDGKLTPEAAAMELLIREHVKTGVAEFREKAEALGATPEQARVIDGEAATERARVKLIQEARKQGKPEKKEPTPEEIANRTASRWIDKLATSQSDTLAWNAKGKISELEALIREHLKEPVAGFQAKAIALGTTPEQARVLDGEARTERARKEMIAQWRKDNPKERNPRAPKKPHEIDWNRPEFTDGLESYEFDAAGRSAVMRKVVALRDIVGAAGRAETLTGDKRAKADALIAQIEATLQSKGTSIVEVVKQEADIGDYRFNIADTHHVAMLARTIQAMNTDLIDKAQEYAFASMLSGLQTNLVNLSGGIVNSTWQATADRAFESLTNLFFQDPANATFGEFKYMARAMGPALSRAWSNAVATWGSETSMFEEDILNRPPDLAKMAEGVTGYRSASIGGTMGRVIRIPLRGLLAADNFVATARACVEVGAMAYRTARIGGLKPGTPEFEAFVKKEVNIPGSMSWQLAAQKAYEGNYNNAMPGQKDALNKDVEVKTSMDLVGYGIQSIASALNPETKDKTAAKLGKAVVKLLFFPFVRVPYNILKQGIDRSINPISLAEIGTLLAFNLRYTDGKWTLNADGQKQRIIENIGKQLQGTMFVALLLALGEGDDDDLEKRVIITGSRPYKETRQGEREAGYRMGLGPYRVSFLLPNGQRAGFNYGRIEPFATIGGGTVDMLKNVKASLKGRTTKAEVAGNILGSYVAQVNEKTMLRGAADLMAILGNEKKLDRFAADRIGIIMPNIIKQVVRESDGEFRETPSEFHDMVIHGIWPAGMDRPVKVDIYGDPQKKDADSAMQRIVDFTDAGVTDEAKDTDRMLYNWIRQNPENKEVPIPQGPDKNWTDPLTKQRQPMTAGQRAKFGEIAGTRLKAMTKGMVFNADKPSEFDMKRFKQAVDKSRDDARKILFRNPTWRALK